MNKKQLIDAFESLTPAPQQKSDMLHSLHTKPTKRGVRPIPVLALACVALALCLVAPTIWQKAPATAYALSVATPAGGEVLLQDTGEPTHALTSQVSYVDNGPQLRFFITGQDIARVEVSSQTEQVSALDFTQTLDEKFWDPALYYETAVIDGEEYQYVPTEKIYSNGFVIDFPEGFTAYDEVWYSWYGIHLRAWAAQDIDARIHGMDDLTPSELDALAATLTDEEKLAIATGGGETSPAGHIRLDGYPEEKLSDTITITITDRQGNVSTSYIYVTIHANVYGQTVVTAATVQ